MEYENGWLVIDKRWCVGHARTQMIVVGDGCVGKDKLGVRGKRRESSGEFGTAFSVKDSEKLVVRGEGCSEMCQW